MLKFKVDMNDTKGTLTGISFRYHPSIFETPLKVSFMGGAQILIEAQNISSIPTELKVEMKYLGDDKRMLRLPSFKCR